MAILNAKFFSDARARRLPYTRKSKPEVTPEATRKPRHYSPNLNPLQIELLQKLEQAGFPGRWWPIRRPPISRLYFNFYFHCQVYFTFRDAATLEAPRLQIRFLETPDYPQNPKDQAAARKLLEHQFQPALEIWRQLRSQEKARPC